jgi:hypothetical protein
VGEEAALRLRVGGGGGGGRGVFVLRGGAEVGGVTAGESGGGGGEGEEGEGDGKGEMHFGGRLSRWLLRWVWGVLWYGPVVCLFEML